VASPSPVRAGRPASAPPPRAIRPATSGRRERGAGRGGAAEGSAPRSPFPSTTMSAGSAPRARAFATTSGPIPRGSPTVTARRGRAATALEADVHVGRASQQVEIVLLGEPLAQRVADPILHVLEGELALRQAPDQLRSEEHTSELQSQSNLVCRLLLEKKNNETAHALVARDDVGR